jgi:CBS domain-containing protein
MTAAYSRRAHSPRTLERVRVGDAMHRGVVTCSQETSLTAVARIMAAHRIHAVVIADDDSSGWGLVSDLDAIAASDDLGGGRTAGAIAVRPGFYLTPGDDVAHAARLMCEHGLHHLIVLPEGGGRPVGVLSSLDVADVLAELPEPSRPERRPL